MIRRKPGTESPGLWRENVGHLSDSWLLGSRQERGQQVTWPKRRLFIAHHNAQGPQGASWACLSGSVSMLGPLPHPRQSEVPLGGFQSALSVQSAAKVAGDRGGRSFRTSTAAGEGEESGDCCPRGRWEPRRLIMFCERAREDQITSILASPSTFFFCFSITASSSDTFSLSWRAG